MNPLKKIPLRSLGLALLSGVFFFLSFSLPGGTILFPFAFVCLASLLVAMKGLNPRQAALIGLVGGFVGCFGVYYWIPYCMIHYAHMSSPVAYLALVILVAILALFFMLFAWLTQLLKTRTRVPILLAGPALWVSIEYLRTYFPFGGFPWALLGASQYKFLQVIQISELGGVYLVSFLVALVNFGVAALVEQWPPTRKAKQSFAIAAACLVAAIIYGSVRIKQVDAAFAHQPEIKVGIVQGNINQGEKWDPEFFWSTLVRHIELSKDLLKQPKDLIVWPEASVTTYFNESWDKKDKVLESLSLFDAYFLFGSISKETVGGKKHFFNSAFMLSPKGASLLGRYDKIHLVPFGEYVPMQKVLFWVDAIAKGNAGDSTPGGKIVLFNTGKYKLGCVICYEVIFPNLCRKFVKQGAQVMSTITNDAWFGPTSAPYQHFSNLVLRAVENRVYFIRAANTGVSAISDPCGRLLAQGKIYDIEELEGTVRPSPVRTLYSWAGDWFAISCAGLTILLCAFIILKRPDKKSGGNSQC